MGFKKEIPPHQEEKLAKARKDALRLLSFRARSTEELRSRLTRKWHEPAVIESLIELLTRQGFLDDEKYAKLYAISRMQSRPMGKGLIRRELQTKGLSSGPIDGALGALEDFDEKRIALEIALERHRRMTRLPENVSKVRLYGFLKRRGFAGEAVFYALSKLYKQIEGLE